MRSAPSASASISSTLPVYKEKTGNGASPSRQKLCRADPLDRDALFANLDQCLQEVWAFETDLKEKLSAVSDA